MKWLRFFDENYYDGGGGELDGPPHSNPHPLRVRAGLRSFEIGALKRAGLLKTKFHPRIGQQFASKPIAGKARPPAPLVRALPQRTSTIPPLLHPSSLRSGVPIAIAKSGPPAPPTKRAIAASNRFMLHGLGDDPTAGDGSSAPIDSQATSTDAFGVPAGYQPANAAWLSQDLFEHYPDAIVFKTNGVRWKNRFALPAFDNSLVLSMLWGLEDPRWGVMTEDFRWDVHQPAGKYLQTPVNGIHAGMYGGFDLPTAQAIGWRDPDFNGVPTPLVQGYTPLRWVRQPADLWRADLMADPANPGASAAPSWYHPLYPIPVDLLSYYWAWKAQGVEFKPDGYAGSAEQFWNDPQYWGTYGGGAHLLDPFLGVGQFFTDRDRGLEGGFPGRGLVTVYDTTSAPNTMIASASGPTPLGPYAPAPPAPPIVVAPPSFDDSPTTGPIDPSTGLPLDPMTGLPLDSSSTGLPSANDGYSSPAPDYGTPPALDYGAGFGPSSPSDFPAAADVSFDEIGPLDESADFNLSPEAYAQGFGPSFDDGQFDDGGTAPPLNDLYSRLTPDQRAQLEQAFYDAQSAFDEGTADDGTPADDGEW